MQGNLRNVVFSFLTTTVQRVSLEGSENRFWVSNDIPNYGKAKFQCRYKPMLANIHPTHSRIINSLRESSARGPENHLILSAYFTAEETEAQRKEVIGEWGWAKSGMKTLARVSWKKNLQKTSWCPKSF